MSDPGPAPGSAPLARLLVWVQRIRARRSRRTDQILFALASLAFLVATIVAWRNLPEIEGKVRWGPLVLVSLVSVPLFANLNALEYRLTARILGHDVAFLPALRISVLGSAANQLPIPGAVMVRIRALRRLGTSYPRATWATGTVGLVWIGTTGLAAGAFQFPSGRWAFGLLLTGIGALALGLSRWMIRAMGGAVGTLLPRLIAVEVGLMLIVAAQYYAALLLFGLDPSVAQAVALSVSVVVASVTGFFPGGLGVRELVAAGISPIVGLPPAVGILTSAVLRVASLAVFLLMSAVFVLLGGRIKDAVNAGPDAVDAGRDGVDAGPEPPPEEVSDPTGGSG